jgi:hypothetical protein
LERQQVQSKAARNEMKKEAGKKNDRQTKKRLDWSKIIGRFCSRTVRETGLDWSDKTGRLNNRPIHRTGEVPKTPLLNYFTPHFDNFKIQK